VLLSGGHRKDRLGNSVRLRSPVFAILLATLFLMQSAVTEWNIQPSVRAGGEYNDNFNLTSDPLTVWNTNFRGSILSTLKTEHLQSDFFGEYRGVRYLNQSNLDADNGTVRLTTSYASEFNRIDLTGQVILDHPSSTQLQAGNLNFNRIERLRWYISPAWTWTPNEYSTFQLDYRYDNTSFNQDPSFTTTRSDFISHSANSSYTYALKEYTSLFGNLSFIETVNDSLGFKSDQFNFQLGINHSFSETLDISLAGGSVILLSETETQRLVLNTLTSRLNIVSQKVSSSQSGYIMNISVKKSFPHTKLSALFQRNLTPTINGGQVTQDSISLSAQHRITEYLSANFGIGASQLRAIQSTLSQANRRNAYTTISLSWRFFERWWLDGGYRFRWLDREGIGAANRNSVYMNLRYDWPSQFID